MPDDAPPPEEATRPSLTKAPVPERPIPPSTIPTPRGGGGLPVWAPIAGGLALVVAAVVLFLVFRGDGDDSSPATASTGTTAAAQTTGPQTTSAQTTGAQSVDTTPQRPPATLTDQPRVVALGAALKRPIYWAGPTGAGTQLELTQNGENIYLRYLTGGARAGDGRPNFLTVGSYGQADPMGTIAAALREAGAQKVKAPNGGVGVFNPDDPKSVYLAFPGGRELIEVYSPTDGRAKTLVMDRRIRPVAG